MSRRPLTAMFMLCLMASSHAQQRGASATAVVTQPVAFESALQTTQIVGNAEALRSVALYPAVADRVVAVNFKPGQWVKQGDVLLALDARRQEVAVSRAEIRLKDAERRVQRLLDSKKQGAVAQSDLDDAITVRDLAAVDLREARIALADRSVIAPFDGVVGLTDIEVGDRINEQTLITTIDDRHQLYINFEAPESAAALLNQQTNVALQPWTDRQQTLVATLAQIDSRVSADDRTLKARALLDNPEDVYRPGMSFRVTLQTTGQNYAVVPEASLAWGATGAYVWLNAESKAKRVDVEIVQRLQGRILVKGDIPADGILIVEGIQRLRPGQAVVDTAVAEVR
ncbi:efflux RND transporter periplasmic adaptor subunit [Aestuariibacter halophilus]|uniref:Efflux RND transporter periplasmic adaptor subunit n=1 Tax=Fluctibacter halophilus TaxID=226011 RepID=A0ABS8GC47_9ALTE|nr:efflux RND transporter periplasmic adaptor subunit [Aestuariibacter halophilus]MCC2617334.1 efflux RND transporter periplasmic adaptor subunit [Aestuariibacter halophilus]